jgi:hypothetical protein
LVICSGDNFKGLQWVPQLPLYTQFQLIDDMKIEISYTTTEKTYYTTRDI